MATLRIATGVTFLNRNEIVLLLCLKRPQKLLIILSIKSEGQPVTCRALHDTVSPSLPRLLPRSLRPRRARPTGFLAIPSGSLLPKTWCSAPEPHDLPGCIRSAQMSSSQRRASSPTTPVKSHVSPLPVAFFPCPTHCCFSVTPSAICQL